ncbi:DUF4440 domain-containing protein [Actinoplanes sp. NPDC051859]|uniref:nuclear transport factor 2 family protein n=1 Tax=Actinoplanes sp. NPDC051859 TaxID=3363909 RepID=UPI00378F9726
MPAIPDPAQPHTAPQDTAPTGTAPLGTVPTGTAPTDTAPQDTAPRGTAPTGTAPPGTAPTGTAPPGTAPPGTAPRDAREELRAAERQLQAAQLSSDVAALDRLLDDRLIFTGPDGKTYRKDDDLRVHRTGTQVINSLHEDELDLVVAGDTGVTWFLGSLSGSINGVPFTARMRYTRTWIRDDEHGWRILAAHASVV